MFSFVRAIFQLNWLRRELYTIRTELDDLKMLIGSEFGKRITGEETFRLISDAEFKVYSQWGDDGIIQYLIAILNLDNKTFLEFGVGDYQESNTRFLLENNNWSGVVFDSSVENIQKIQRSDRYWKFDLLARHLWVTKDNINDEIRRAGLSGEIGLLHIDLDGNDYWIWQAIEVVKPVLAIIEYNSVFGISREITVPYQDNFDRTERHYSNIYFGASLRALCYLAKEKGYSFIGCNSAGNNAYFIKSTYLNGPLMELTPEEGYVLSKFRESRDKLGQLSFLKDEDRLSIVKGMPVVNVRDRQIEEL